MRPGSGPSLLRSCCQIDVDASQASRKNTTGSRSLTVCASAERKDPARTGAVLWRATLRAHAAPCPTTATTQLQKRAASCRQPLYELQRIAGRQKSADDGVTGLVGACDQCTSLPEYTCDGEVVPGVGGSHLVHVPRTVHVRSRWARLAGGFSSYTSHCTLISLLGTLVTCCPAKTVAKF